jgi:hypothetical protein
MRRGGSEEQIFSTSTKGKTMAWGRLSFAHLFAADPQRDACSVARSRKSPGVPQQLRNDTAH